MGGGDLNTKKSWHPNTIKNQERVWKAEQEEAQEKRRIEEMRREMEQERNHEELVRQGQASGVLQQDKDKKMDWMYKTPNQGIDHEQYLLGKKVDKSYEQTVKDEQAKSNLLAPPKNHVEHECIPFSIRNFNKDPGPQFQVDMSRKILEDPLMAIKKREIESRTELLNNPVRLKELTRRLKDESHRVSSGSHKKKKKKNKREDLDRKLAEKLLKLSGANDKKISIDELLSSKKSKSKKTKKKKKYSSSSSSSDSSSEEEVKVQKKRKHEEDDHKKRHRRDEETSEDYDKKKHKRKREKSEERSHHRNKTSDDDDSENEEKQKNRGYGLIRADGSKISLSHSKRDEVKSQPKKAEPAKQSWKNDRPRLSEREKEQRRLEMMKAAVVRDKERESNVSYHRERDKKLEARDKHEGFKSDFVEKELRKVADVVTVEGRIKSNIYNIQRSKRDMDSNFARRY